MSPHASDNLPQPDSAGVFFARASARTQSPRPSILCGNWGLRGLCNGTSRVTGKLPAMARAMHPDLELARRIVAEGEQNLARQREVVSELGLQTARELLQEMARYWQMRVEEIRTLAGFAGKMDDVEAAEIMLRIAGDYERLVQQATDAGLAS